MLESWIDTTDLTNREPEIADYYRSGQTTWAVKIEEARDILEQEIRNRGRELKHLCTRLNLTNAVKSNKDHGERNRLVIVASSVTSSPTFSFQGTNDVTSETWTTITVYKNSAAATAQVTTTGTTFWTFRDTYDYYKITWTGTITSTQYLVERSFELPHIELTLALIYKSLTDAVGEHFDLKAQHYMDKFYQSLDRALYSYDSDEDGDISQDELTINRTVFRR